MCKDFYSTYALLVINYNTHDVTKTETTDTIIYLQSNWRTTYINAEGFGRIHFILKSHSLRHEISSETVQDYSILWWMTKKLKTGNKHWKHKLDIMKCHFLTSGWFWCPGYLLAHLWDFEHGSWWWRIFSGRTTVFWQADFRKQIIHIKLLSYNNTSKPWMPRK